MALTEDERKARKISWQKNYRKENHDLVRQKERDYHKRLRLEAMNKIGGQKCVNCGCDIVEILEINHKDGGGRQEIIGKSNKEYLRDIIYDKVDTSKYDVRCRVCNALHYVEELKGIKGHKVIWEKG